MSDEKIDLDKVALDAARMVALFGSTATYRGKAVEMLSFVTAVRAALLWRGFLGPDSELDAALAPFIDSAEVSDGR